MAGGRLTDPALLVEHGDDGHGLPSLIGCDTPRITTSIGRAVGGPSARPIPGVSGGLRRDLGGYSVGAGQGVSMQDNQSNDIAAAATPSPSPGAPAGLLSGESSCSSRFSGKLAIAAE